MLLIVLEAIFFIVMEEIKYRNCLKGGSLWSINTIVIVADIRCLFLLTLISVITGVWWWLLDFIFIREGYYIYNNDYPTLIK